MATNAFELSGTAPDNYNRHTPFMLPLVDAIVERARIEPGMSVLDVACGTGFASRAASAAVGPQGRVVGLDINESMLAIARMASAGITPPIAWHLGSALEMSFADNEFHAVLCQQGVQFFPNLRRGLEEMCRVLAPRGRLAASFWADRSFSPYLQSRAQRVDEVLPEASEHGFIRLAPELVASALETFGMHDVVAEVVEVRVSLPPMSEYVPNHTASLPIAEAFAALPKDKQQQVAAKVAEDLRDYERADGTFLVPFVSNVVSATK